MKTAVLRSARDNSQHRSAKNSYVEETRLRASRGDRFSGRSVVVTRSERTVPIQHYFLNKTNRVTCTFQSWKGFWIFGASDQSQRCYMTAIKIITIGEKGCRYLHWYKFVGYAWFIRNSVFPSRCLTLNFCTEFLQHMVEIKTRVVLYA